MAKKPLEIDMIAGSQLRDTQGEMLSVEGADISELNSGNGRLNDNHGKGFFNSIGRVTAAKKIFGPQDCTDPRHTYYWEKVKAPFVYVRGVLYDDEDHPNAKAAAAILRNIHKSDTPLKLKASVEGGVLARGMKDEALLARTKIHSVALTFTPANTATLVEPLNLEKGQYDEEADSILIKSVVHLAVDAKDVPSFRHIARRASAEKIMNNINEIKTIAKQAGLKTSVPNVNMDELVVDALQHKIAENINKINELTKALTAGYGGAGSPTGRTGGSVLQSESLDDGRGGGFKYITCKNCGHEQIYMKHQVKCRDPKCGKSFSFKDLVKIM